MNKADFTVAPTLECRRQLQKHGMLFKETPGGFVVLYETTGQVGVAEPKRQFAAPFGLSFVLRPKVPFLLNYSDLPLDKSSEQIFYLTNRQKNLNDGRLLLSAAGGSEFLSASDLLPLRSQRFPVDLETSATSILWELQNHLGTLVDRQRVASVEGQNRYQVDLGDKEPGWYQLRRDGAEYLSFYAADHLVGGFPFGLIEIAVDSTVNDDFSFVAASGKVQFKRFQLKLQARETIWEYLVVAKYETELKPNDLEVTLDDPPVPFSRQTAVSLADGSTAIPFIAGAPLPLRQQPIKGITLRKKKGPTTPKLDIDNLPNPSVAEVIPEKEKVISRMYIYV